MSTRPATRGTLVIVVGLAAAFGAWIALLRGAGLWSPETVPESWTPQEGTVYLTLEDDTRFVLFDRDEDGLVDCAMQVRRSALAGLGSFRSEITKIRCTPIDLFSRPMSPDLHRIPSELLRQKAALSLGAGRPIDTDLDGAVDCVVSVFEPHRIIAQRTPAPVPARSSKSHGCWLGTRWMTC